MITVKVPATSANLGAGFDSCGVALSLYNTARMEEADGPVISSADGTNTPTDESNLIYQSARRVYEACGKPFRGMKIIQESPIPMARGLGSSSACIVAGILGANALLGDPFSKEDAVNFATSIEGHPDNVAPAILGGFVVSAYDVGHVYSLRKDIAPRVTFAAFIPDFELLTETARAALPKEVPHRDAVYNLSRAALLATAFCTEQYEMLPVATKDMLHQPYRLPLIENGEKVFELAKSCGALGTFISGAGPTILAVVRTSDRAAFLREAGARLQEGELGAYHLHCFDADNAGAVVE